MNRTTLFSALLIVVVGATPAVAIPKTHKEINESTQVFSEMLQDSDTRIPRWLMRRSKAIAIITNLRQGGFVFGGRRGDGVMVSRHSNGAWSNPAFINLTGGSFGFQAGYKNSDVILVFPSQASLNDVLSGNFELGGSVSGTAGPLGRSARESLEGFDDDKVFVYTRSKGLFGSVALEGSDLSIDNKDNRKFYGKPVTVRQIFTQRSLYAPPVVNSLKSILRSAE